MEHLRISDLAGINPEQIKDNYKFNEIEYIDSGCLGRVLDYA